MRQPIATLLCSSLFILATGNSVAADAVQPQTVASVQPIVAPGTPLPDIDSLLSNLVDGAIIPLYSELNTASQTLSSNSQTFCQATTPENFQQLRQAWGETMLAWQRTDALLFGPATEEQIDFSINFTPPKKLIINRLLKSEEQFSVELVDKSGVGGQGLSTLEFLLFDRDKSDTDVLAQFQGEQGQRRCEYVQAASELLQRNIGLITEPWLRKDNSYADAFRQAEGSPIFSGPREAIDMFIGKLYQSAEKTAKQKLGIPLAKGATHAASGKDGEVHTNAFRLPAWRSGYSVQVVRANLEGIQRLLKDGGLFTWLREHNDREVEKFIADSLEKRLDDFLKLPIPEGDVFAAVEKGDTSALDNYYHLGSDIQMGIKRQLAKVMGVQLGFNDNDGD